MKQIELKPNSKLPVVDAKLILQQSLRQRIFGKDNPVKPNGLVNEVIVRVPVGCEIKYVIVGKR